MIGIKLEKKKAMSITNTIETYLNPERIYIPLILGKNKSVKASVKVGDFVKKGTIVAELEGKFSLPIFASVSGKVEEIVTRPFLDTEVSTLVIRNDHKELEEERVVPSLDTMTREKFVTLLKEKGIVGLSGNGFPTYVKYQTKEPIKTLIVNAVECEPYLTADYMLLKTMIKDILEGIDLICSINQIEEAYLAIKVNNDELKEIIQQQIKQYPILKLKEVPNLYPMGWEKSLVQYIKHVDYKVLPIEKGILVENVATVYAIYEALRDGKPLIERVVTFTGEGLLYPQNRWVRFGTLVEEIFLELGQKTKENVALIAGGPMMGLNSSVASLPITSDMNGILLLLFSNSLVPTTCLRCGKCVQVCPVKISPVLIKDHLEDKQSLQKLSVSKCIGCGLCSYICPAKIPVRNFVAEAKERVKGGKA